MPSPGYERLIANFPKALQNLYLAMTAALTVLRCHVPMLPCLPCFSTFSVRISVRLLPMNGGEFCAQLVTAEYVFVMSLVLKMRDSILNGRGWNITGKSPLVRGPT